MCRVRDLNYEAIGYLIIIMIISTITPSGVGCWRLLECPDGSVLANAQPIGCRSLGRSGYRHPKWANRNHNNSSTAGRSERQWSLAGGVRHWPATTHQAAPPPQTAPPPSQTPLSLWAASVPSARARLLCCLRSVDLCYEPQVRVNRLTNPMHWPIGH